MAGIEKITAEIINAAEQKAQAIIDEANQKAKEIIDKSLKEAENGRNEILENAKKQTDSIKSAADSACALDKKNKVLSAKIELINSAFDKAVEKLKNLDTNTYFSVIKRLCVNYAVKGSGTLALCEGDIKRMPSGFIESVNADLSEGKTIVLCENGDNKIDGGCIIKYDEIEINCTFEKIIDSEKERLIDSVNNVLFC